MEKCKALAQRHSASDECKGCTQAYRRQATLAESKHQASPAMLRELASMICPPPPPNPNPPPSNLTDALTTDLCSIKVTAKVWEFYLETPSLMAKIMYDAQSWCTTTCRKLLVHAFMQEVKSADLQSWMGVGLWLIWQATSAQHQ